METKNEGIYDGFKQLGTGRMMVLGFQHVFAMFGATVLVPLLTGLSVSVTLMCAGLGTIWFYFITKKKIPIFLGSSFAFLGAFASIANGEKDLLPYACLGVFCAGLVYVVLAILFKVFGAKKIMKLFPPVVTGPIIVLIGLILSATAVSSASANWILAIAAIAIIICVNLFAKGMIKILPILFGMLGAYVLGVIITLIKPDLFGLPWIDFSGVSLKTFGDFIAIPHFWEYWPLKPMIDGTFTWTIALPAIITFVIVALAAMVEHIGDICAIGATCNKNFIADPGLTRTLLGDGIGTSIAGFLGGPANTTYSENTGVVALTKVYDPKVMLVAAIMTLVLSCLSIFETFINTIPWSIIGGVSIVLYGMISATGVRTIVENQVDFKKFRNIIIAALIFVCGLGFNAYPLQIPLGSYTLSFGGLAVAAVVGIILNLILPGKDYEFDETDNLAYVEETETLAGTKVVQAEKPEK